MQQRKEVIALCFSSEVSTLPRREIIKLRSLHLDLFPQYFSFNSPIRAEWDKALSHLNSFLKPSAREWLFKPVITSSVTFIITGVLGFIGGLLVGFLIQKQPPDTKKENIGQQETKQVKTSQPPNNINNKVQPKSPALNNALQATSEAGT